MLRDHDGLKVLVADDSVVVRRAMKRALSDLKGVAEVTAASSGKFAMDKIRNRTLI